MSAPAIHTSERGTAYVRVPLSRKQIGRLLDALSDARDPYGYEASALELRLQDLYHALDKHERSTR